MYKAIEYDRHNKKGIHLSTPLTTHNFALEQCPPSHAFYHVA